MVENSSKRCAVKPIAAVKGFFCAKRHAECVSVHHFLSHDLICTALLKWWQANIVWIEQNLPTSGSQKRTQHSLKHMNKQSQTVRTKEQFCWLGFYLWCLRTYWVTISIIPKADIRQQLWSLPNVRFHRLCVEKRKHLHFTFNFWTQSRWEKQWEQKPILTWIDFCFNKLLPWKRFTWTAIFTAVWWYKIDHNLFRFTTSEPTTWVKSSYWTFLWVVSRVLTALLLTS